MAVRDWHWPQWMLLISCILLLILGGIVVYVLLTPAAFTPAPDGQQPGAIGTLPTPQPGRPTFPPSDIERIPLTQIQGTELTGDVDIVARGDITQTQPVAQFPVSFVNISSNGSDLNYYDPETSRFYRIDGNGVITKIGQQVFAEVEGVTWGDNNNDAIVEFPDSSNIRYNFETNEQVTLPSHWDDFDFAPGSQQIAFKSNALDPDQRWLAVSDANGSSTRLIEPLGENGNILDVDWAPNNQVIGTYSRPDSITSSELFFVGFNGENFPLSKLEGLKFEGKWVPDGKKIMYSVAHSSDDFRPRLWLVDGSGNTMGQNRQSFNLNTWPSKCTFASNEIAYCGVPKELPRGSGLIPSVANTIPDDLYRIDLRNVTATKIATPQTDLNVETLSTSADGQTLFIHDRFTQTIRKVNL